MRTLDWVTTSESSDLDVILQFLTNGVSNHYDAAAFRAQIAPIMQCNRIHSTSLMWTKKIETIAPCTAQWGKYEPTHEKWLRE